MPVHAAKLSPILLLSATLFISASALAETGNVADYPRITVRPQLDNSLTVPNTEKATQLIQNTPGAVDVVSDTEFKNAPANNFKDVLGWVPGVMTQNRWGPDGRLSIRGSGLSRNYGNRGINMYMDGVPINTADGLFDLFEIDPSAYQYVEVYKGANALRYGANSLGGAINFVTPTGYDAAQFDGRIDTGSFGYIRSQASTGGVSGPIDYFITGSAQREDGYRDHSRGDMERASANIGYQFSKNAETRFYLNANTWRNELPGEVTKDAALNNPKAANSEFTRQDQQRNINSIRLANKTSVRFDTGTVDFGVFGAQRHVDHPIYQYLDYNVRDYGGFTRATDERYLGGYRNRFIGGVNLHNGKIDTEQFINLTGGIKGALASSMVDTSQNYSVYAEDSFYFLPDAALVLGGQYLHAIRDRRDRFLSDGDQSGKRTYDLFSPKAGLLWDVDQDAQIFTNISRSGEVPTYDANSFATPASTDIDAQTATTYEIGTRGKRTGLTWDVSAYRAQIKNELQCLTTGPFSPCTVVNADKTVHQGIEAGLGFEAMKSMFDAEDQLWVNTTYTYNDFFFDNDATWGDNELPGVPRHSIRVETLYKHPVGFYAGPNVEWIPQSYYADNANSLKVDPYALVGFRMGYDGEDGLSGYIEGRNLFDTRYISSVAIAGTADPTSELFNPGTGRAVYAGMRYRF